MQDFTATYDVQSQSLKPTKKRDFKSILIRVIAPAGLTAGWTIAGFFLFQSAAVYTQFFSQHSPLFVSRLLGACSMILVNAVQLLPQFAQDKNNGIYLKVTRAGIIGLTCETLIMVIYFIILQGVGSMPTSELMMRSLLAAGAIGAPLGMVFLSNLYKDYVSGRAK